MFYVRRNKKDFDQWKSDGCTGWSYENVLKYFKKSEDMRRSTVLASFPKYHSAGGYVKLENFQTFEADSSYAGISKGMKEMGYNIIPD